MIDFTDGTSGIFVIDTESAAVAPPGNTCGAGVGLIGVIPMLWLVRACRRATHLRN